MVEVRMMGGTIRGVAKDHVATLLGVPYADPPFAERRIEPPAEDPYGHERRMLDGVL